MARTNPQHSQDFNIMLLIAAIIAGILAFCVIAMLYGCARHSSPPKPREPSAGMYVMAGIR